MNEDRLARIKAIINRDVHAEWHEMRDHLSVISTELEQSRARVEHLEAKVDAVQRARVEDIDTLKARIAGLEER